jgi:hypothetical protein
MARVRPEVARVRSDTKSATERKRECRAEAKPDGVPVAVGYVRVSTEEQAREGVSLAAQDDRIRSYCALRGMQLRAIYRDEAVSAGRPLAQRPQGAVLLDAISAGDIGNIVALKLDRLFRNAIRLPANVAGVGCGRRGTAPD